MSVYGIVSEFNPFHKGHEYIIQKAKEMGAEAVVCVMSGNSTQRGQIAVADKYLRAEAALRGGADLVLELPYPWCSGSAESFAKAAISILSGVCDTVIFGSECGDIDALSLCAYAASSEDFKAEYSDMLLKGSQSAAAYTSLMKEKVGHEVELSSNDLLGIEYIKAALALEKRIKFVTVKRSGSGYLCDTPADTGFSSAMAIRKMIAWGGVGEELREKLPEGSFELLCEAKARGELTTSEKYLEAARFFFRMIPPEQISKRTECGGGVAERMFRVACESSSGKEFFESLRTKRYTDSKLRRAVLFGMTGVRDRDLDTLPAYSTLLAANEKGRELLSECRRNEDSIQVVTKMTDISKLDSERAKRQTELAGFLSAIFTFCQENSSDVGSTQRKKPFIT